MGGDYIIADRKLIIDYLEQKSIPAFDAIVDFQLTYSGLDLEINGAPGKTFECRLFSKQDIAIGRSIEPMIIGDKFYFDCGDHATAPFWFVISEEGKIGIYDHIDETVNIIFSSFDKFIETYAFKDFLNCCNRFEHPYYYSISDRPGFGACTQHFFRHYTANDAYNIWLSDNKLVIHMGTWYHKQGFYIHVYGEDKTQCELFIQSLERDKIISSVENYKHE